MAYHGEVRVRYLPPARGHAKDPAHVLAEGAQGVGSLREARFAPTTVCFAQLEVPGLAVLLLDRNVQSDYPCSAAACRSGGLLRSSSLQASYLRHCPGQVRND